MSKRWEPVYLHVWPCICTLVSFWKDRINGGSERSNINKSWNIVPLSHTSSRPFFIARWPWRSTSGSLRWISLRPTSHPYHSNSLCNLANTLLNHFGKTGSTTDLEEAILLHRESLFFRPTQIRVVLYHFIALHVRFGIVLERQVQWLILKNASESCLAHFWKLGLKKMTAQGPQVTLKKWYNILDMSVL